MECFETEIENADRCCKKFSLILYRQTATSLSEKLAKIPESLHPQQVLALCRAACLLFDATQYASANYLVLARPLDKLVGAMRTAKDRYQDAIADNDAVSKEQHSASKELSLMIRDLDLFLQGLRNQEVCELREDAHKRALNLRAEKMARDRRGY